MNIIKAISVLEPGESAVVVFTRGINLKRDADGNGSSGSWKLNPRDLLRVTRIIIYDRNDIAGRNWVFSGKLEKIMPSINPNGIFFISPNLGKSVPRIAHG